MLWAPHQLHHRLKNKGVVAIVVNKFTQSHSRGTPPILSVSKVLAPGLTGLLRNKGIKKNEITNRKAPTLGPEPFLRSGKVAV